VVYDGLGCPASSALELWTGLALPNENGTADMEVGLRRPWPEDDDHMLDAHDGLFCHRPLRMRLDIETAGPRLCNFQLVDRLGINCGPRRFSEGHQWRSGY
jgi:hypothetical protein